MNALVQIATNEKSNINSTLRNAVQKEDIALKKARRKSGVFCLVVVHSFCLRILILLQLLAPL